LGTGDDRGPARRREPAQRRGTAPNRLRPGSAPLGREFASHEGSGGGGDDESDRRRRGYGAALAGSLALHVLLLVYLAHQGVLTPTPEPPPILVSILPAPPPPPPPPLASAPSEARAEKPVEVPVEIQPKPESIRPDSIKRPQETKKPKPRNLPTPPPARPAEAPGVSGGVVGGSEGGTVGGTLGGVDGGKLGGVVGGQGDAPVPASQVAVPPVLLSDVRPKYPPIARARGVEGLVVVEVIIDHEGHVESDSVQVKQSASAFDAAATEAVRQWRFRPARNAAGRTVRVILEVPIRFQLR
jgi:periplasmic protein TonB